MSTPWDWGQLETRMFDDIAENIGPAIYEDRMAQALYDSALFNWDINQNDRYAIQNALRDYMRDEYDADFDAVFDWEGYRSAYDGGEV